MEWVRSFVKLAAALKTFIKQHYEKGLEWNSHGIPPEEALKNLKVGSPTLNSSAALTASRGGPPPPPPPPLPQFDMSPLPPPQAGGTAAPAGGDMGAVFSQLNRGETVTSGLRKVDKSEMTHKNPSLREKSTVPTTSAPSSIATSAKAATSSQKPPKTELDGNKWNIENHSDVATPIQIDAERNHSILISRCNKTTIRVNGKANAISIDNCTRLDLIMDSLVSSVGVVNSGNFRMQVLGTLPSIQLDQVDGATIYLSQDSLNTELFTSKCSSVNITLPPASGREEDDSVETPVPEQIRSWVEGGKLMSEIVKQEG